MIYGPERKGETGSLRHRDKNQTFFFSFSPIPQSVSQPCILSELVAGKETEMRIARVQNRTMARDQWFRGWRPLRPLRLEDTFSATR